MPQTFHPFRRLPRELRDMIWKFAIRPARPGAHFFRVYNPETQKRLRNEYAITSPTSPWHEYRLTVPKWVPRPINANWTGISGKGNNPSTYLIDGALWTTCKESRLVMERQFNIQKWEAVQQERLFSKPGAATEWLPDEENMSSTGYFVENSTYRYFAIFPYQDLVCIQPYRFETIGYSWRISEILISLAAQGSRNLENVALEFNLGWRTREELGMTRYILGAFLSYPGIETLWFIDYSIQRRHHVHTKEQAAQPVGMVFYGSDCRFIEVARDRSNDYLWEGVFNA
ncbi:hypothetical protein F5Y13DRAFT_206256 [Hypoxylon sp. FL1857]|nr:hypothetical protein F5Y13DRAFT_206256 [Hypoxylon sp. FL1857]